MNWVEETLDGIRADEPGVKLYVEWWARQNMAVLAMLQVPEERRGQGVARRIVETLTEAADLAGAGLSVTPTNEFGADAARLTRFYEGFGFVRNVGENRDWRCWETHVRQPGGR